MEDREAFLLIHNARKAHPEFSEQILQQLRATMRAVVADYPFSWLSREHVLDWIKDLPDEHHVRVPDQLSRRDD